MKRDPMRQLSVIIPEDPWYNTNGTVHKYRATVIASFGHGDSEADRLAIQWATCVLDRAFHQAFEYADPDRFGPFLKDFTYNALKLHGEAALHFAAQQVKEKALALGIPERDW